MRRRFCRPPPHWTEHESHGPHEPTTQLTAHWKVLHRRFSALAGHEAPPYAGWRSTLRERCWKPVPHEAVQRDQPSQSPVRQSTGQGFAWHADTCVSWPEQRLPPKAAAMISER